MTALPLTRDQEDAAHPLKKGPARRLAKGWTPNSGETAVRFQLCVSAVDTHSASPPPIHGLGQILGWAAHLLRAPRQGDLKRCRYSPPALAGLDRRRVKRSYQGS